MMSEKSQSYPSGRATWVSRFPVPFHNMCTRIFSCLLALLQPVKKFALKAVLAVLRTIASDNSETTSMTERVQTLESKLQYLTREENNGIHLGKRRVSELETEKFHSVRSCIIDMMKDIASAEASRAGGGNVIRPDNGAVRNLLQCRGFILRKHHSRWLI